MTRIQEIILHKDTGEYIMIEGYPKMPNKYRICLLYTSRCV